MKLSAKSTIKVLSGVALTILLVAGTEFYLIDKQQHQTEEFIAQFHQQFNAGKFDAICHDVMDCADGSPFGIASEGHLDLADLRERYGKFQRIIKAEIQVSSEPPWIKAEYWSSFEKGQLKEIFVLRILDRPPVLILYKPEPLANVASDHFRRQEKPDSLSVPFSEKEDL